jgi:hypothetical protein
MVKEARVAPEVVVAAIGKIEADGELRHAGFVQGDVLFFRHQSPVRNQDDVRQAVGLLYVSDDFHNIVAQHRLAARDLHDARLQRPHVLAVLRRLELLGLIPRATMVAMTAKAIAGVRNLKGHHDGTASKPIQAPLADNLERFGQ